MKHLPSPNAATAASKTMPALRPTDLCTTSVYEAVPSLLVNLRSMLEAFRHQAGHALNYASFFRSS